MYFTRIAISENEIQKLDPIFTSSTFESDLEAEVATKFDLSNDYLAHIHLIQYQNFHHLSDEDKLFIKNLIRTNKFNPELSQSKEILQRYKRIDKVIHEAVVYNLEQNKHVTERLDKIFTHKVFSTISDPHSISVVDFDKDKDIDVIVAGVGDGNIVWHENLTNTPFSFQKVYHKVKTYEYINLILLVIFILILFSLVRLLFKNYSLTLNLEKKNKALSYLKQKNTSQEIININLENIIADLGAEAKESKISSKRWTIFLNEYQKNSPDFYIKLKAFQLTKAEFRLAIFIVSNLDSHEIANLLSVNVQTIYIQKQRLKNKLNLKAAKEIEGFLRVLRGK